MTTCRDSDHSVDLKLPSIFITFKDNQTRLQLFALAYNLANFLRRLALPRDVEHWSLTTLREKLVKIGAKVTRHAKYVTFQLAEVAVPRRLQSKAIHAWSGSRVILYGKSRFNGHRQ